MQHPQPRAGWLRNLGAAIVWKESLTKGNPHRKLHRLEKESHSVNLSLSFLSFGLIRGSCYLLIACCFVFFLMRILGSWHQGLQDYPWIWWFTRKMSRIQHMVILTAKTCNKSIQSKISTDKKCMGPSLKKIRYRFPRVLVESSGFA